MRTIFPPGLRARKVGDKVPFYPVHENAPAYILMVARICFCLLLETASYTLVQEGTLALRGQFAHLALPAF